MSNAETSLSATHANCLARGVVTTDGLRCLDEAVAAQPYAVEISSSFSFQPAVGCRPWRLAMLLVIIRWRGAFGRLEWMTSSSVKSGAPRGHYRARPCGSVVRLRCGLGAGSNARKPRTGWSGALVRIGCGDRI